MKCAKCGAELKVGCIYCSVCGQEAQIVSDSSLLEEEWLRELLRDEKPEKKPPAVKAPKKKRSHKPLIISLSCVIVLLIAGAALFLVISHGNDNSYEYQMQKAEKCLEKKNYTKALKHYERALELNDADIDVRMKMAELYLKMEEENSAISILHEIISLDDANQDAYEMLIALYKQEKDYDAIVKLKDSVSDDKLSELFSEFSVLAPIFSIKPGTYHDTITIELTAEPGDTIYYTTDESDPEKQGEVYKTPFVMDTQGSLEITAVCQNEYGLYSESISGTFTVRYEKPAMATAIPDSGNFSSPTMIRLIGSEGSQIYYTWDGSTPTIESAKYTEPIPVPEGNNILSVLLVDKHGMTSDVLKCNYRYFP